MKFRKTRVAKPQEPPSLEADIERARENLDLETSPFGAMEEGGGIPMDRDELVSRLLNIGESVDDDEVRTNPFIVRQSEGNRFIFSTFLIEPNIRQHEDIIDEMTPNVIKLPQKRKQRILLNIQKHQQGMEQMLINQIAPLMLSIDPALTRSAETLQQTINGDIQEIDATEQRIFDLAKQASILKCMEYIVASLQLSPFSARLLATIYLNSFARATGGTSLDSILHVLKDIYAIAKAETSKPRK